MVISERGTCLEVSQCALSAQQLIKPSSVCQAWGLVLNKLHSGRVVVMSIVHQVRWYQKRLLSSASVTARHSPIAQISGRLHPTPRARHYQLSIEGLSSNRWLGGGLNPEPHTQKSNSLNTETPKRPYIINLSFMFDQ